MDESIELRTFRIMAWERAKGELNGVKQTYWHDSDKYRRFVIALNTFILAVEEGRLHE